MSNIDIDSLFIQRLDDSISACTQKYTPCFTKFLDGRQLVIAKEYLAKFKEDVICVEYGGFCNAERCILGMFPKSIYGYDGQDENELYDMFELSFVKIQGSGYKKLTHRDFLGSILALGVKRETVGDIIIQEDTFSAYVAFTAPVAKLVCSDLTFIGSDKIKTTCVTREQLPVPKREYAIISGTVASFRIDCILSLALNTSREKAKKLIDSKSVSINHIETEKCDVQLCEGDLLSVRGYGRYSVATLGDVTKKGRNRIEIHKML